MRQESTPDQDIEILIDYCIKTGLVKDNKKKGKSKKIMEFIKDLQWPYLPILLNDDFTEPEAYRRLNKIFASTTKVLSGCKNYAQLESRISDDIKNHEPSSVTPYNAIKLLPGFVALSPFKFKIDKWMLSAVAPDDCWERTNPAMRYLEIWQDKVSPQERAYIIKRLIDTDEANAAHPLAIYSDKIVKYFNDDTINKIFKFVYDMKDILPILSVLPVSKVPNNFQSVAKRWSKLEKKIMETDSVFKVKHINRYVGTCDALDTWQHEAIISPDNDPDMYGNVTLIYVNSQLIGSMNIYGECSVLGLRTIKDSQTRLPVVIGGAYVTTQEITDKAIQAHEKQGKWARLDVERLPVFPLRFVDIYNGISKVKNNVKQLQEIRDGFTR